jgi:Icc-related predicted phosphoesterase
MKILCVSDNVIPQLEDASVMRRQYSDVDLCVSCGDMPASYLEYIVAILNVPLFYVRGNHDLDYAEGRPGGENLHQRVVTYRGLRFAGFEGSIRYNQGNVQYSDLDMSLMVLQMAPRMWLARRFGRKLDVLVAHSPPWGIHDIPTDKAHRGFRGLRRAIRWFHPRYYLHGHVHTWDNRKTTETEFGDCTVLNINPVRVLTVDERS